MMDRRAIVIGGGIAGMCAARALSDFFDHVIVIERDKYPDGVNGRGGVPQSRMFHTLIERGRREVEALFPGFHAVMDQRGSPRVSFGFNAALMSPRGWRPPLPSPRIRSLFTSRGLLECTMRDLFRKLPNVELLEETGKSPACSRRHSTIGWSVTASSSAPARMVAQPVSKARSSSMRPAETPSPSGGWKQLGLSPRKRRSSILFLRTPVSG